MIKKIALLITMCSSFFVNADYPLKKDVFLEANPATKADSCLTTFLEKGGTFHLIPTQESSFKILTDDAIYPICSGGWCRSQTLYAFLKSYQDKILLFSPHAARLGWDPYNGQINRYLNRTKEKRPDEYALFFGEEKAMRMGFENDSLWENIEKEPTTDGLKTISEYYNENFYGPNSLPIGHQNKRRVYVVFAINTHIVLHRLIETNASLENVHVVACDLEDIVSKPPKDLKTQSRSIDAYANLLDILKSTFDIKDLL